MKVTDKTLSAFLDNELTEAERESVRKRLAADPALAHRLAELALGDAQLQTHDSAIDDHPMRVARTGMLETEHSKDGPSKQGNVVTIPWWHRLRGHAGKTIAAAVIAGVALTQWLALPSSDGPAWSEVANALDRQPSGVVYQIGETASVIPRLTFRSQRDQWCRQYRLETTESASEQIACRSGGGTWEQVARAEALPLPGPDSYQPASGGSVLDETLDGMMAGSPIGPDAERALLQHQWGER
ncbi:MAG: hypothetical protein ABJM11_15945 [Marinobacter sp.]|uniref:hypothetical protein n=1 Tax=Marinobacter sp. TaxID=50741 RepID=UPI00329A4E68